MQVETTQCDVDLAEVSELPEANPSSIRKTVPFRRRKDPVDSDLESTLSSALLAGDKELSQLLRELDQISEALRSDKPDTEAMRVALHPAVWCAVKHALLERELRHLAVSDDLTCLYNRRGFFAAAAQQLKLARRNQNAALLLFCDLDNLKAINDSFGHREGDLALVRTADALEDAFRDSDVLARLGGDEFAVLAIDVSPADQEAILFRLQESLKKASRDESRYDLSLSTGAAWFDPQHTVSIGELMEQADRAMYAQKRNRHSLPRRIRPAIRKPSVAGGKPDVIRRKI
jgi:diguanylate cyclase (GGDEF)-like protein